MDLEERIEELYGLPLEAFTDARNDAARTLRKAGSSDEADAIAALRKPTVAAWAVNQLARRKRRDVDLLLDSGKRLLDAQRTSLERGGRADLDRARRSLDDVTGRLVEAASSLLGKRGSTTTLERIAETLRSAAIAAEGRELLARGTFVRETTGTGWDVLTTLAPEPGSGRPTRRRDPEETGRDAAAPGGLTKPDREEERRARASERRAERERRDALRSELRLARQQRATLVRSLSRAQADETRAARTLEQARQERTRAEQELARLDEAIERARSALEAE